ncbi:MAG: type II toxin-antitoxin system Phd/YefM family antitoxin [Gammaproteobacteria bacterium]
MHVWPLQDAKARLSELVRLVNQSGAQSISVHGKETVVVISLAEYEALIGKKSDFLELMNHSPLKGIDLSIERDQSLTRDIDL